MKNRWIPLFAAALMIAVVAAGARLAWARRPDPQGNKSDEAHKKSSLWMSHKLVASQKILEGMTRGDFEMIEKHALGMQAMGYLESWVRADRPGYKAQVHAFDNANDAIVHAAREKNLDGVTLGYTQLTISCVQCHKIVRDKSTP